MAKRRAIHTLIIERGAIHKSAICRELDFAWGTVGHHLRQLSKRNHIMLEYHGNRLWAFPAKLNVRERTHRVLLAHGPRKHVVNQLSNQRPATIRQLSDKLESSRRVIRTHLMELLIEGVVERQGPAPHNYTLVTRQDAPTTNKLKHETIGGPGNPSAKNLQRPRCYPPWPRN
jgi:predicted transcriptional regulator